VVCRSHFCETFYTQGVAGALILGIRAAVGGGEFIARYFASVIACTGAQIDMNQ
jgi:hypothetical protein